MNTTALTQVTFHEYYRNGRFHGILRWNQLDALWHTVSDKPEGWYAYLVNEDVPDKPLNETELRRFIAEVDRLLRTEHEHDYCGIVYADNPGDPLLIKIFDPNNLGASCGSSGKVIPPRWLLSRIKPEAIVDEAPLPASRRRWWQRVFGG